ncbi:1262_t:CDS:1 [Cetraspora pellucida]|uniref:1262_t:CDS:1 n=1 Tax=Cetraspora pellucida TaxID=1433469 RepID=A0ACA9N618_9GLOM|nr:1262_t:CDS:1 [Cetraspora pellucida]
MKRTIRQPRPTNSKQQKTSFGMPSSHSTTIIYFATFISLQLHTISLHEFFSFISIHITQTFINTLIKLTLSSIVSLTALSVVWSRVALGYHTRNQVIVGMVLGFWLGIIWDRWWWRYWNVI